MKFILMLNPWVEFEVPTFKVNEIRSSEISSAGPLGFPGDFFFHLKARVQFPYLNLGFSSSIASLWDFHIYSVNL